MHILKRIYVSPNALFASLWVPRSCRVSRRCGPKYGLVSSYSARWTGDWMPHWRSPPQYDRLQVGRRLDTMYFPKSLHYQIHVICL